MPVKIRVSSLAKDLGISSTEAVQKLNSIGEYVKSASATVEEPAARRLREACAVAIRSPEEAVEPDEMPIRHRARRPHLKNSPFADLGATELDHLQTADRRSYPPHRLTQDQNPFAVGSRVQPRRRPRQEWYRGPELGDFNRAVLDRLYVPRRGTLRAPAAPWSYYEFEVDEAADIVRRWMPMLFEGLDFDEILDWRDWLDPVSTTTMMFYYPRSVDDAIDLHQAGIFPQDLRWRPEDEGWGTLADRLRARSMTVAEVVTEVGYRGADDAKKPSTDRI